MSRGGVASRRCEVLLDILAAFRGMYDTYGGDGWDLSRDGEAAALRKVFNVHMSRGGVASRRSLHKVFNSHMSRGVVASRRCEVLLGILAAFRGMYDTYGGDGWGLSRDGEAAALHKVFNLHMSRGVVASRRCEVLLGILAAFRGMYDTYGGDGWGLSRDGEAAALRKVFNLHMSRGGVASRRCEVLLDILAAFRDMYGTYGGDGWGLSRDGEAAPLRKVFNLHMSRGGVASRRCEVLLDILAAFRDMYDTYGGDGWGLSRDGEAAPLRKVFNSAHVPRWSVVRSFSTSSPHFETCTIPMEGMDGVYHAMASLQLCTKCSIWHMSRGGVASRRCEVLLDILAAFRDMYDTYGGDGWGLSRDGEAAALHKVFNSHMSRGGVASRRCEVLLDILAAFRDMYDTYGGDGWGLSRDGEAAALHKVFNSAHVPSSAQSVQSAHVPSSAQSVQSRTCPEVEWHPGVVRSFSTSSPHFETCTIPMEGMDGVYHAMASLQLCTKCSISHMSRGVVASRRCEVLLDVLAAFRDMYDTYGGDGWGLSRDGEPAPLHKVFNLHMSRGVVASRRCEVLLDVLAAFRDMYDTYGGDGWGLSRDGEAAALHKVFNLAHVPRWSGIQAL
ncbi:hypothetical protein PSENEW3_00004995 [Picochlorum sp. SENEW3]|nr:hypothetical protein PSENEW3_00004995 [Picochlorum sp. SENEW3]